MFTILHCMVYYSLSLYLETKYILYVFSIYILYHLTLYVNILYFRHLSEYIFISDSNLCCLFYLYCINVFFLAQVIEKVLVDLAFLSIVSDIFLSFSMCAFHTLDRQVSNYCKLSKVSWI